MPSFSPGQGTNYGKGREISDAEMALKQRYTAPTQFQPEDDEISGAGRCPDGQYYSTQAPAPVKYYIPGPEDQYIQNKEANRTATGAQRIDPISEREVQLLQQKKEQAEVADFDIFMPARSAQVAWRLAGQALHARTTEIEEDRGVGVGAPVAYSCFCMLLRLIDCRKVLFGVALTACALHRCVCRRGHRQSEAE
mmetsp:Transcript_10280/g.33988  ORF Transcript_10280/g.33988 Transcript_10280/m.33988 type:complete len:195 (+) Transcript_10280:198-782(+)|eukprot:scaffold3198_cov108-Isochrysis_galbana.AAC.2